MRFLDGEIADKFFSAVLEKARGAGLLSEEHFTIDGTLVEAWASHKSFKPKHQGPPIEGCDSLMPVRDVVADAEDEHVTLPRLRAS